MSRSRTGQARARRRQHRVPRAASRLHNRLDNIVVGPVDDNVGQRFDSQLDNSNNNVGQVDSIVGQQDDKRLVDLRRRHRRRGLGHPGGRAGLAKGDRIISLGGKTVTTANSLSSILQAKQPGDKVKVVWVTTSGKQQSATVTLASGPAD